ncbi:MAG TPA: alpha/beta hydrolase [Allosphingosinicella sp.]|nr:alpha/beta hydrolase [Allosphingosinicella sp.]
MAAAAASFASLAPTELGPAQHASKIVEKPAAEPFVSQRISVMVQGSGPDVILIPGLTASRDMWKGTVAALPGYRYHLVQVNGFAGTKAAANAEGPLVDPLASEIARYIRHNGLKSPALVGHSMGGTLAMKVAARHPEIVGRVMVVDMLPQPAGLFGGNASIIAPIATSLRNALTGTQAGRRLLTNLINGYGADNGNRESDPDVVARAMHELALTDLAPELPKIGVPMTVLFASPAAGTPEHARIAANYRSAYAGAKGAKLKAVPDSGHMIMYDQPERFRAELKAFLAR